MEEKKEELLKNGVSEEKTEAKKTKKKEIISWVRELVIYGAIFVACVFLIPNYVVARTVVDGTSMERTLQNHDSILMEKISYRFGEPKRFDVIIFYHFNDLKNQDKSDKDAYEYYVKRVIGLPGETVQIKGSTIYINGKPLKEDYGKDPIEDPGRAEKPITLGADEYFVLGDNREVSIDSRSESVGNVKCDWIAGKACVRVYPFSKVGGIE